MWRLLGHLDTSHLQHTYHCLQADPLVSDQTKVPYVLENSASLFFLRRIWEGVALYTGNFFSKKLKTIPVLSMTTNYIRQKCF